MKHTIQKEVECEMEPIHECVEAAHGYLKGFAMQIVPVIADLGLYIEGKFREECPIKGEKLEAAQGLLEKLAAGEIGSVCRYFYIEEGIRQRGAHEWEPIESLGGQRPQYFEKFKKRVYIDGSGKPLAPDEVKKQAGEALEMIAGLEQDDAAKAIGLKQKLEGILEAEKTYITGLIQDIRA